MADGQRRRYFHLGHEVMCAAGGVVAGAVLAWWIKPSVIVSMEPADFGFDDDDLDLDDLLRPLLTLLVEPERDDDEPRVPLLLLLPFCLLALPEL